MYSALHASRVFCFVIIVSLVIIVIFVIIVSLVNPLLYRAKKYNFRSKDPRYILRKRNTSYVLWDDS